MKVLDLAYNDIKSAGRRLAESIRSWGDDPPLEKLSLWLCSIPEEAWSVVLSSLATCKHLKVLYLAYNDIGAAGCHLAQSIRSWGDDPPLDTLDLEQCSIPEEVWSIVLKSLATCNHLKVLYLSDNYIGAAGRHLAPSIRSWGDDTNVNKLHLSECSIQKGVWPNIFSSLSVCGSLCDLNLSLNYFHGSLSSFIPEGSPGLPELRTLDIRDCGLNRHDIVHLTSIIQRDKLPGLTHLDVGRVEGSEELQKLKGICKQNKLELRGYKNTDSVNSLFNEVNLLKQKEQFKSCLRYVGRNLLVLESVKVVSHLTFFNFVLKYVFVTL